MKPIPWRLRFWSKVDKSGPIPAHRPNLGRCWVWTAYRDPKGYGRIGKARTGPTIVASRASFFLEHGRWPEPCALHKCDNSSCVRPSHIFEGTRVENNRDMVRKGRHVAVRPKLTAADAVAIRAATGYQREIAERFGVHQTYVSAIRRRVKWRNAEKELGT